MSTGTISLVVPTYNVGAYLPEFLDSLDAQTRGLEQIELIFVNDGSTDQSATLIEQWIQQHDARARLLTKPNGGLSSARNAGLDAASGEWITFCDPDDVLDPTYLAVMRSFVQSEEAETVHLIASNIIYFSDETGLTSDSHPLRFRFEEGNRVVDLERHPHFIHVSAATGLYRRAVLDEHRLRFDDRVQPVWEDGHLTCRYLAKFVRPRIAMMADAVYLYRRRADGSSLMQNSWTRPGKFLDVPRFGWLDALQKVTAERGSAPLWLQNTILYDMLGYFRQERRTRAPTAELPRATADGFYETVEEIMGYLDSESIDGFAVTPLSLDIRKALLLGLKGLDARPPEIAIDRIDVDRGLVRLRYFYSGAAPVEVLRARGFKVRPVYEKTRASMFYGRTLMYERTVWLPATGALAAELDGRPVPLRVGPASGQRSYSIGPGAIWRGLAHRRPPRAALEGSASRLGLRPGTGKAKRSNRKRVAGYRDPVARERRDDAVTMRLAQSAKSKRRYRDAWLLIDRDTQAQDNAEHLYRYLREHQPQINAWFVLARESDDWARLERDGFRLLANRSREHKIALLNCEHLLSSQIDGYIINPLPLRPFGKPKWRYTFLQHGVTKDDLSIWINHKPISLMITATPDEHASIVGNGSPYTFSDREIRLTGFPRHDRLLALGQKSEPEDRNLILITPTWRRELLLGPISGGNDRQLRTDFWESTYARQWRSVLASERLHETAADHGWEIEFIPHPNMQGYLDDSPLPDYVRAHRFREVDIQEVLARAGTLVTDYSSMAFDMAYLERPVVYFQFDQETFFRGVHAYRRGSWSYEDDGFGPVTTDADAAVDAIIAILKGNGVPEPAYAERMAKAFPFRDGQCSRRTFEAVRDIKRPLSDDELYLKLEQGDFAGWAADEQ